MPDAVVPAPSPAVPTKPVPADRMARAIAALGGEPAPAAPAPAAPAVAPVAAPAPATPDPAVAAERQAHAIRQERAKLAAERAKWEADQKASQARQASYRENPLLMLQDYFPGIPADQVIAAWQQALANPGAPPPPEVQVASVKQDVQALRKQLEERDHQAAAAAKAAQEREYQEAIADVKTELHEYVTTNASEYPVFLAALEGEADATGAKIEPRDYLFAIMDAAYKADGTVLSPKQAAEKAEKFFEGKAARLLNLAKFKSNQAPQAQPRKQEVRASEPTPSLSNPDTPLPSPRSARRTEAERMAAAIAAIPD